MNNKGNGGVRVLFVLIGMMLAIMCLFAVIGLISPLKTLVDDVRSADSLNCASAPDYNSSATSEQYGCLIVDVLIPVFCGIVILASIGWILMRPTAREE